MHLQTSLNSILQKTLTYFLIISASIFLLWKNTNLAEKIFEWHYDYTTKQTIVTQPEKIKDILNSFPTIPFSQLKKEYLTKTKYDKKKYNGLAKGSKLLIIRGKDVFKYIVGSCRIKDFLPKDDFYYENIYALGEGKEVYWMVDEKVLFKLLDLQNLLNKNGYNESGFSIVNGFRHPAYNEEVGGASLSRHLKGQALDLQIGDINNDGYETQKDKTIILDFLEKEIIKDQGGIGRYPGTMSVHFDVRGYRARWDKQ
jgi:hypothetical protein